MSVVPRSGDHVAPRKSGRQTSAVDRLLRRWLFVAVLPLVAVSLGLHELTLQRNAQRTQDTAAMVLAQSLASQWRSQDRLSAEEIRRTCERVAFQPSILGSAVFNPQGERLAQTARHENLLPLLSADRLTASSLDAPETLVSPDGQAGLHPFIQRVDIALGTQFDPQRPARVVMLIGAIDPVGLGSSRWGFCALITGTAALGLFLAHGALRRRIARPIERLLQVSIKRRADTDPAKAHQEPGELEELTRCVNDLKEEAFHWRGQAERVERRMALQLASQTREISRDLRKFQREAWLDPLTRVKNRRFLDEQLPIIFAAHRDADLDLSLVMLDLDHFKRLNDERGHPAGDEVLGFLGELLRQCLRADDIPVRFGGDEFVLILPGVCADDAVGLTKRLMALFAQRVKVMFDGRTVPGITAGIAALINNHPATPAGLLAAADQALYQAKKSGRGGIQVCRPYERKSA